MMKIRLLSCYFWLLFIALLPVALWQAKRTRERTPKLPEAEGEHHGYVPGSGTPLNVLLLGESTAVGVGVNRLEQGLAGYLVRGLAQQSRRPVRWQLIGENGVTAAALREKLRQTQVQPFDIAVMALGANDVKELNTPARWRQDLAALLTDLHELAPQARVYVSAVPPIDSFPALPQPLRLVMGVQADRLRASSQVLIDTLPYVRHMDLQLGFEPAFFARDGLHPSELGYERWAQGIVAVIAI